MELFLKNLHLCHLDSCEERGEKATAEKPPQMTGNIDIQFQKANSN